MMTGIRRRTIGVLLSYHSDIHRGTTTGGTALTTIHSTTRIIIQDLVSDLDMATVMEVFIVRSIPATMEDMAMDTVAAFTAMATIMGDTTTTATEAGPVIQ